MARLEDLHLSNTLVGGGAASPEPAVQDFLDEIETLQSSGDYDWAGDTLAGIYDTVKASGRVTDGQRTAVRNIGASREANRHTGRMQARGWGRRYEGR